MRCSSARSLRTGLPAARISLKPSCGAGAAKESEKHGAVQPRGVLVTALPLEHQPKALLASAHENTTGATAEMALADVRMRSPALRMRSGSLRTRSETLRIRSETLRMRSASGGSDPDPGDLDSAGAGLRFRCAAAAAPRP